MLTDDVLQIKSKAERGQECAERIVTLNKAMTDENLGKFLFEREPKKRAGGKHSGRKNSHAYGNPLCYFRSPVYGHLLQ